MNYELQKRYYAEKLHAEAVSRIFRGQLEVQSALDGWVADIKKIKPRYAALIYLVEETGAVQFAGDSKVDEGILALIDALRRMAEEELRPAKYYYDNLLAQQDEREFNWFLTHVRDKNSILEIGACYGCAMEAYARVLSPGAKIRIIDDGRDDYGAWHYKGTILNARVNVLGKRGFDTDALFSDSHLPTSVEWAKKNAPYDIVFIDGDHSYEGAKNDWENYGPLGKVVGFHDVANPYETGPQKLWNEIKASGLRTEECSGRSTMGIGIVFKD